MSTINNNNQKKYLENKRKNQFSNKTYIEFKNDLLSYAKEFYSENILDFSDTSLGGLMLDFAAIVGDSLTYYAEQQFNELDYETATDVNNINKHLRRANIKNNSAYPSSVDVTFTVEVEVDISSKQNNPQPYTKQLPIIKQNTILLSNDDNVQFVLDEDVDFTKGNYTKKIKELNEDGSPYSLLISKKGSCTSGFITSESADFTTEVGEGMFLSYKLENSNVTKIISVFDNDLNEYFEVDYLTQGTIFKKTVSDNEHYISIKPVPYRYVLERDFSSGSTMLRFGNGEGKGIKNDTYALNSELLIPVKNSNVFGRVDVDPSSLLKTNSLGVSPSGKSVNIVYKFGGGISHNVRKGSINKFYNDPIILFKDSDQTLTSSKKKTIIESIQITNELPSQGGAPPPTIENLKYSIPSSINSQNRIINDKDLIARILTMPTDFGKIEKVIALDNKNSSSFKDLFIICKNSLGHYENANDSIKINLSKYINEFRSIGDNYNILDAEIFNFGINATVRVKPGFDIETVLFDIQTRIVENINFYNLQIGEPIDVSKIEKTIIDTDGVLNLYTLKRNLIVNKTEKDEFFDFTTNTTKGYSNNIIDPNIYYSDGLLYSKRSGIFELKYSTQDIQIIAN